LNFLEGTGYVSLPGGDYSFDISPVGSGIDAAVLSIPGLSLMGGGYYSAVAYGRVADLTAMALGDDRTGLGNDQIRVQVAHTAAAVGEVDIWNLTGGQASALLENVPYGASALLPDLPVGTYEVGIDANDDGQPDLSYTIPELRGGHLCESVCRVRRAGSGVAGGLVAGWFRGAHFRQPVLSRGWWG
ncbi:MAG TPA: DUF4397 domain-containing protein, partial [Myxococcota bacterium]|nr:DUF4397 domain-containing protein [Myxococcota bacterium]